MRRRIAAFFSVFLLILGAGIFLYPKISGYLGHIRQARVLKEYQNASAGIEETVYDEMLFEARVYNERLARQPDFNHAAAIARKEYKEEYGKLLALSGDAMGSIRIPKIGVELPLYHGTEERYLAKGVGHYEGSSLPVGGKSTHTVLTGHRGLPSADLLTRLDELEKGDIFLINTLGREIAYQVDQIKTVLPHETEDLGIVKGQDYATLVTCTPYGINTHRLLVRGVRIPDQFKKKEELQSRMKASPADEDRELKELIQYSAVVLGILLLTALLLWKTGNRKTRKDGRGEQ